MHYLECSNSCTYSIEVDNFSISMFWLIYDCVLIGNWKDHLYFISYHFLLSDTFPINTFPTLFYFYITCKQNYFPLFSHLHTCRLYLICKLCIKLFVFRHVCIDLAYTYIYNL